MDSILDVVNRIPKVDPALLERQFFTPEMIDSVKAEFQMYEPNHITWTGTTEVSNSTISLSDKKVFENYTRCLIDSVSTSIDYQVKYNWCAYKYAANTAWTDYSHTYSDLVHYANRDYDDFKPKSRADRLKEAIRTRMSPAFIPQRQFLLPAANEREERARETLRLVVGEESFRRFLKDGFVIAQNRISGRIYQIYPGHDFTKVYENGKMIDRLCVVLRGDFPPTDSVIVRYLMALNNEAQLWALANKHGKLNTSNKRMKTVDLRSLPEIFGNRVEKRVA